MEGGSGMAGGEAMGRARGGNGRGRGRGLGRGNAGRGRGRGRGESGFGKETAVGRTGKTSALRATERTFEEDDEGWEQVNKHRAARVAPSQTS